ncbi:MAG: hypothetical protein P9L89_05365, partial [Candidatus Celaenobacter polaris]|nr:hypothetical protein [Candidatus Celaenobacter polaris]
MTTTTFQGLLNISRNDNPILWEIPFDRNRAYYDFPHRLISEYKLVSGAWITCEVRGRRIEKIISIC